MWDLESGICDPASGVLRDLVALNMTLRLSVEDYERLAAALGGHEGLRKASAGDIERAANVGPKLAADIARVLRSGDPDEELRQAAERSVAILPFSSPQYPAILLRIPEAPLVLYVQGELQPADAVALAIVGSRFPTHYGTTQAGRLASELAARGMTIVSGLAQGIDTAAHRGALDGGGRTIAVLGGGLASRLHPPDNAPLADEISRHGAIISDFPLHTPSLPAYFPRRNRIVSGLALGVLVVEADFDSGALITADWALAQGREVFALPGRVTDKRSRGCHLLIKQGAKLVETSEDVLEELGDVAKALAPPRYKPREEPLALAAEEQAVYGAIGDDPTHIDAITDASGLPAHQVASTLMLLELKKAVTQLPGKHFVRKAEQPE
ncbi:MAG: DNA-protecting protein DprA [Planctomycetes bacterium]|nr:DNA-protecting protein DprA [Planctomycetota bacterium]